MFGAICDAGSICDAHGSSRKSSTRLLPTMSFVRHLPSAASQDILPNVASVAISKQMRCLAVMQSAAEGRILMGRRSA